MVRLICAAVVLGVLVRPASAAPQEQDPLDLARVRLGSFGFTPAVMVSGGYDSNVTREPGALGDYEFVTLPFLETWLHLGRFVFNTQSAFEVFGYPHELPTWTFNNHNGVSLTVEGSRVEPKLQYVHRNTYARPTGFEINSRSRRLVDEVTADVKWFAGSKTTVLAEGRSTRTNWDASAENQGSMLRETLNGTSSTGMVDVSYAMTPLTSFTVISRVTGDRFDYSPERDADTVQVSGGVTIKSPAFISGSALLGYSHFSSPASGTADYRGLVSAVNLLYANESRTAVRFAFDRYPSVSYTETLGYYLLTSVSASVSQTVFDRWVASVFAGHHLIDYSQAGLAASEQQNTVRTDLGGGLSWRPGPFTRIGVDVSSIVSRGGAVFNDVRVAAYFVYGSDRLVRVDRPLPEDR